MAEETKPAVVIKFEMAIETTDGGQIPEACREALEVMRQYGAACATGSYEILDYDKWPLKNDAVTSIKINQPIELEIDR